MSQRAEQTSFFSAFLNYAKVNTSVTSKSMGSLDSKIGADGMKSGNSCNSPRSCEIKCRSFKKETELSSEKSTVIKKFLSSPEKKLQRENDWLIDFNLHVEKAGTKKQTCPKTVKELSEKESENQIGGTMSHSPAKHKVTAPRKSPKHDCSSLSAKDLQSSPSQNLRQRIKKDSKSQNDSSKSKSVRGIQFNKDENSGVRRNLRPGKRKRQEEHVASDTDSEISFKPMPKRRRVNLTDTYKMAPLSPLQTRGRKLAKAVKGLQKTITEKREFKKLEKQTRLARTSKVSGSPKKQSQLRMQKLRMCQKRKYEAIRSSPRTKNSATPSHGKEMEESVNKQLRHHFKQSSDSQSKRINPVIKKRRQKMKYKTRMLVNEKNESKLQSGKTSSKTLNSVSPQKLSPKTKQDQNSQSFQQLCEINSSPKRPGSKISAGKQAPHSLSPSRNENKSDSLFRLEDAPFNQKSLSFSSLAGTSISRPLSYRITTSPKLNGLPAVLSLSTLSGIPHQIQGSTFSSVHPGFGGTAVSGKKTFGVPLGQPKLIVQRPFLQPKPVSQLSPTSSPRAGSSYKNNGKKKVYTCEICRRQFSHRASRSRHRKVHQKEASQGNLLRLLKKTPAYKCGICEKQFSQNSTLLQHRKFHGREKENFLCGVCEKQFDQAWSLIRHRKIHLSEKPYKCDVCGKCFIEKFNLKHHQYTHTGEKPYTCDTCGKSFSQQGCLKKHKKKNHNGSQSLPATPTTSTSDMGFFRSSPRPNTLSISNSSSAQGINKITSNQSALDSSTSYHYQGENNSQFTKLKTKRTLAETVDMLRHTSNLNGLSVFKYNSFKKKTLTPSDDQSRVSSRNSSRSNSPSITPIKSEVLTPSCTPCSTPRKSPSCSPSPSLDKVAVTRLKGDQKYLFRKGDKVLAQWHDGLYYLGIILKIEEKAKRCLLRYEDNSKYWSLFKDIHRGARDGEMICCVCMSENSEKPNEIVLCDNCGQGYHQNCHSPAVRGSEILDPDDEWCCRKCIFALTMKAGGALKEGKYGDELRKMKLTFPYDLKSLSWDTQHKTNTEQYYCYCGGPGVWYQKMLQCCRCKQWFHEACIQCLKFPLMFADSFYIFVCSACNFGQEYIKRLNIDWPDLVHISIFNMSMENNLKYYEFDEDIMMWINDNWDILQVKEYDDLDLLQRREEVKDALNNNKSRFKNGTEIRKRQTLWGLRVRVPPPRTHITLPVDGLVNDEVMKDLKVKGRRSKVFMPIACKTPVQMRHSPLQLKGAARRRMLQNSPLLTQNEQEIEEIISEPPVEEEPEVQGPLLDRLIPPASSYEGYNHPFKHEIEQTCEKIETEQRLAIWNHFLSKDKEEDDSVSLSPEGPPVLVKEEPVENLQTCGDMSPPLSETSESSHPKRASRRSNTPTLISAAGLKRSKRISGQKITRNTPPHLEQNPPVKQEISVTKVKSAKANYLCAFDKLGYGKGLYVLGKRETEDGKLDYLISW